MKNLSFVLALALICISMFSCGEKSIVNPQNEDFKITTFSPVSGFIASDVTLFGENLDKDSVVSVSIGDQPAEIISRSSDSLIVKVPRIAVGKYDITVKTQTKSYVYDKQYEVLYRPLIDDLTQIKNVSFDVKGFKVKSHIYSYYSSYPGGGGSSDTTRIIPAYYRTYKSSRTLVAEQIGLNKFKIKEIRYPPLYIERDVAQFEVDYANRKFSKLKLDYYGYKQYGASEGTVTEETNFSLDLVDVGFVISEDDSIISIKLIKEEIIVKLNKIYFDFKQGYQSNANHASSDYRETFLELLGINDNATIEIKFTK